MFGQSFKRMESLPLATEGEHTVTLGIPSVKQKNGYVWLEVPITYEKGEKLRPDNFTLFDPTDQMDLKQVEGFCRKATKIFDCFDLKNTFDNTEFPQWKGHQGKVIIAKDKNDFLVVKDFIKSKAVEERQAKQNEFIY